MSDHLTEEQFSSIIRRVNLRYDALSEMDHVAPVHVARDANNDARELITALEAEREVHQATRAKLAAARTQIKNLLGLPSLPSRAYMIAVEDSSDPDIGVYAVVANDIGQAISYAIRDDYGALFDLTPEEIIKEIDVQELHDLDGWAVDQPAGTHVPVRLGAEAGYWGLFCDRCGLLMYIDEVATWDDDDIPVCEDCVEDDEINAATASQEASE